MATSSISGLASGLDSAGIVNQLMQLEAVPQARLRAKLGSEQSVLTKLQGLNTKTATLFTKAEALAKPPSWSPLTATSSNPKLTVATTSSAGPTRLDLSITSVARAHQLGFAQAAGLDDVVTGASTSVRLDRLDGTSVTLDTGDGSLRALAETINNASNATGLRASLVKSAEGSYRLLVESIETGAASDFALTAEDGSALLAGAQVRAGSDAVIDLGLGISVTSTTNTFADVLPGMSLTLAPDAAAGDTATVAVSRDTATLTAGVKDLVDSLNTLLKDIDAQTGYNAASKTSGALSGDPATRSLRNALLTSVYPTGGGSMAAMGIEVTRDGTLKLDEEKLTAAYAADPAGVAAAFTSPGNGFADRVAGVAKGASDARTGTISASITGRQSGIQRLENSVEGWDRRLELRRTTLSRQFTALETALGAMSSQSSWLASQIASLPTYN